MLGKQDRYKYDANMLPISYDLTCIIKLAWTLKDDAILTLTNGNLMGFWVLRDGCRSVRWLHDE